MRLPETVVSDAPKKPAAKKTRAPVKPKKPTRDLAGTVNEVTVTAKQREKFLSLLRADKSCGIARALHNAGVAGTTGQLRAYFDADTDLQEDARLARGWNINRVEGVAWEVALDKNHQSWDRANARVLKAYHPAYRDSARIEHTGKDGTPMEVTVEHDYGRLLDKLEQFGIIRRSPDTAHAADLPVLPARTD